MSTSTTETKAPASPNQRLLESLHAYEVRARNDAVGSLMKLIEQFADVPGVTKTTPFEDAERLIPMVVLSQTLPIIDSCPDPVGFVRGLVSGLRATADQYERLVNEATTAFDPTPSTAPFTA